MEKIYQGIGLMSGTSLDGLDIAYCRFVKKSGWTFELLNSETIPYTQELKSRLSKSTSLSGEELKTLDNELGKLFAKYVNKFIDKHNILPQYIASHGHTIFHQPERGLTHQIGNVHDLRRSTGLPIVFDFRSLDVALGGQGAPLVPVGDHYLFNNYEACLNIGGIANYSQVVDGNRIAYDIAPANMPINFLANKLGLSFDNEGAIAASGISNQKTFNQLNNLEYYGIKGSKSLGYEWINNTIYPILEHSRLSIPDQLATLCEHIGYQIGKVLPKGRVLITGGGAFNTHLVKLIKKYSDSETELILPTKEIIEFKEAIVFSFLGLLRLRNETNCFRSVTGATKDSCSGSLIGNFSSF